MQVTLQDRPHEVASTSTESSRHFGVTLGRDEFDATVARLVSTGIEWLVPVSTDDEGEPTEQTKAKLVDPSGNVIELKTYRDVDAGVGDLDLLVSGGLRPRQLSTRWTRKRPVSRYSRCPPRWTGRTGAGARWDRSSPRRCRRAPARAEPSSGQRRSASAPRCSSAFSAMARATGSLIGCRGLDASAATRAVREAGAGPTVTPSRAGAAAPVRGRVVVTKAILLPSARVMTESSTAAPLTRTAPWTVEGMESTVSVRWSPRRPAAVDVASIAKVRLPGS